MQDNHKTGLPIVAIVGRQNVGKSTLFNRIVKKRDAVVDDFPGVTRDRNYAEAEWAGVRFLLADTGGFIPDSVKGIEARVKRQVELAIAESDVVVFLTDGREGPNAIEKEIAEKLRKSGKPSLLVVNKVDKIMNRGRLDEFFELALSDPIPISAAQGLGVGDFLDELISRIPKREVETTPPGIRVAVVGRPNVGKSSFVNGLLKEERLIVDEKPGTTRDSIDTPMYFNEKRLILVDTAGLRKRTKVTESLEYFCTLRSLKAIEESEVAILITDASEGPTKQDKAIAVSSDDNGKCLVVVANKSDLLNESQKKRAQRSYGREFAFVSYAPVVFASALRGEGLENALELAILAVEEAKKKINQKKLREAVWKAVERVKPAAYGGKWIRITGCKQRNVLPPRFVVSSNEPKGVAKNYLRYLEKRIRAEFGFAGTPIKLSVVRGKR